MYGQLVKDDINLGTLDLDAVVLLLLTLIVATTLVFLLQWGNM